MHKSRFTRSAFWIDTQTQMSEQFLYFTTGQTFRYRDVDDPNGIPD